MAADLRGTVVLVTGAARGIGEHTARLAAARGAQLALVGREPERLAALAGELGAHWAECDVTDQPALDAAVASTLAAYGRIDAVVANAGVANLGTVALGPVDALVRTVDVNLNGVIRTAYATLPHLVATRGYLLLVSSAAAFTAMPGMAAYCASKAGVEQFGNVLRMETAHLGVAVGTAHPVWIDTDLVRGFHADLPSFRAALRRLPWPLRSVSSVPDCARALVRAIERRQRRVYVPRSIAGVQALRTVTLSRFADWLVARGTGGGALVTQLEAEVRQLGRSFGSHSVSGANERGPSARRSASGAEWSSGPSGDNSVSGANERGPSARRSASGAERPSHRPAPAPGSGPSFTRRGSGEPLVLIHGIGHRWQAWEPVLDRLAEVHDVIALDLPGFGGSPVPPGGMPADMLATVALLPGLLAELGVDRPHVAGNSLGGAIALELAAAGLVASATALSPAGFFTAAERRRAILILTTLRANTYLPTPLLRGLLRSPAIRAASFAPLVTHPTRLGPDRALGDALALRRARGFRPVARAARHYRFTGTPTVPVTVAWGTRDRVLPPRQADRARAQLPAARHVRLPGCGHVPMSDDPALVASVILSTTAPSR